VVSALLLMVRGKAACIHCSCTLRLAEFGTAHQANQGRTALQLQATEIPVRCLQAPQHAKFSFFASNEVLGIWTVCW
jgi:hypothetical protein